MTSRRRNQEGTIYQRSTGKWRAQITIEGERLSFAANTQKEARAWLRSIARQITNGLTLKAAKSTFGEYLDDWLISAKSRLSAHSWRTYCQLVRDYIGPSLGNVRLQELTPSLIQHFYNKQVSKGRGLRTIQKTHTVIHASLNSALRLGLIDRNPDDATQAPKPIPKQMEFFNEEQVYTLLKVAEDIKDRNFAMYYIAIVTGMRQGELLGLRWNDINLEKGIVNVSFNLRRIPGGGLKLYRPKTNSSIRSIRIGKESIKVVIQHQNKLAKEKSASNGFWQDSGHVFPSTIGTPMDPTNLLKKFRQLLKKAGLPRIRFHDLRHTAASLMLNNGIDVLLASQRLGHAKPSITLDVYGHLIPSMQIEVAEILDNLITA